MLFILNQPWPYLATAVVAALIGWYVWRQPDRPGIRQFRWLMIVWVVWALAATFQTIARSQQIYFWLWVLQSICVFIGIAMELLVALAYTGNEKWLARRSLNLLFLPAPLFLLLAIFSPNVISTTDVHSGIVVYFASALTYWVFVGYVFGLVFVMLGVLISSLLRAPAFQIPIFLIILGQILTAIGYVLSTRLHITVSPIQLTSLLANFVIISYFVAIFYYRLMRVLPVARDAIIAHIPYGLIVLDSEDYLVDFNPAATALPGLPGKLALRQPGERVLGGWWESLSPLIGPDQAVKDILIQSDRGKQVFLVRSLPLLQSSGWRMGQVFVVEDITQARLVQQQRAQVQWAQATLEEREQLADELHDGLSQSLAFLNMQAQTAQVYLQTGQEQTAQSSLQRLVEAVEQIQEDTREMIDHLLSVSMPAENFCVTLHQMLSGFEKQTGLAAHLYLEGEAAKEECYDPSRLPPPAAVQLVRITQEALTNIRKHAHGTSQVKVKVKASDSQMELTILDDGSGFDPAAKQTRGKHFGLQIMRQRAARIGGKVIVESNPGTGTRIEVSIPLPVNVQGRGE